MQLFFCHEAMSLTNYVCTFDALTAPGLERLLHLLCPLPLSTSADGQSASPFITSWDQLQYALLALNAALSHATINEIPSSTKLLSPTFSSSSSSVSSLGGLSLKERVRAAVVGCVENLGGTRVYLYLCFSFFIFVCMLKTCTVNA